MGLQPFRLFLGLHAVRNDLQVETAAILPNLATASDVRMNGCFWDVASPL
jgi:hypothetical protein